MGYGIPVGCRWLGVEKEITASAGSDFLFDDDKTISNSEVWVFAIQAFTIVQLTKSPGGKALISAAGALGLTVTLQDLTSTDRCISVPYYDFIASLNTGYPREIEPFSMVLTKSGVHVTDATSLVTGEVVFMVIWYMYQEDMIRRGIKIPQRKK